MGRSILVPASLTLVFLAGCGENKPPNPPAPAYQAPAGQPADQPSTDQAADQAAVEPSDPDIPTETADAEPTGEKEAAAAGVTDSEEMPEEKAAAQEETVENTAPAPADGAADDEPGPANEDAGPASPKRGSPGKLLRGLTSSLSRALSKATGGADSRTQRPPPDLADDPFPNGEPAENNAKE